MSQPAGVVNNVMAATSQSGCRGHATWDVTVTMPAGRGRTVLSSADVFFCYELD